MSGFLAQALHDAATRGAKALTGLADMDRAEDQHLRADGRAMYQSRDYLRILSLGMPAIEATLLLKPALGCRGHQNAQ